VEAIVQPPDVSDGTGVDDIAAEHVLDSREAGNRFLRGSTLRLGAFGAGLACSLGATPLAVHHLGPVRWGQYATVSAVIFVVAAITEGGLGQMGVHELSVGDPAARAAFMRDLLGLRIALTSCGAVAAVAFTLIAGYPSVVVEGSVIAGVGLLLTNLAGTLTLPLAVELRLGWLALTDFAPQLTIALVMVLLVAAGAGLLPFYAAPAAGAAVTLAIAVAVVRGRLPLRPAFRRSRWRGLIQQTIVYAAATATAAMYFRIVLLATSLLSTRAQTGYYSLSFRILELTTVVPWLITSSAFPILVRSAWNDPQRLRYALQRLTEGALILGGWLALCLVIGAPVAIHLLDLGNHTFDPSIAVLRILGAAVPATFVLAVFAYTLLSLRLYRPLLIANATIIVLAVVGSAAVIPSGGAKGAAFVTLGLEFVLTASYVVAVARARSEIRPTVAGLERIALALLLAFGAGAALYRHPVVGVVAGTVVLPIALFALRAFPAELIALVRGSPRDGAPRD
jgi:O-antigen/teichoic acid export membrane protein